MIRCPACGRAVPEEARFCPGCGAMLSSSSEMPTRPTSSPVPGGAVAGGRFLPGAVLADRYRIVAPLGRGGMGEVYRADDLKPGQPVALTFLPAGLERSPDRLAWLLNEVRLARQVAHPNVCRVCDVGEVEGHHFISIAATTTWTAWHAEAALLATAVIVLLAAHAVWASTAGPARAREALLEPVAG